MNKEALKKIVLDQTKASKKKSFEYVSRSLEKKIVNDLKTDFIIIVSGIRRAGKSTLLDHIRAKYNKSDYYFNFDDDRLINFTVNDFQKLVEVFLELYSEQDIFYFDEIQNIDKWERFARRLHNEGKKVYITGSNASMLSRELGTHLTGRYLEWSLFPFSFQEFLNFKKIIFDKKLNLTTVKTIKMLKLFREYVRNGGLPEYLKTKNEESLKLLYENVLYRDIIARYNLTNEKPIKELVYFCASNIGKEISFNSLKNIIGLNSSTTVKEYFEYLENSFLVFLLPRYEYSLKKQIIANKKVYFIDTALVDTVGFRFSQDEGRFLENVVFLELKRRKKEIFYHKQKKECDFVVRKGLKIIEGIQVTKILDKQNEEREVGGLIEAMNRYKLKSGIILTMEQENSFQKNGKKIKVLPIWKWLLGK